MKINFLPAALFLGGCGLLAGPVAGQIVHIPAVSDRPQYTVPHALPPATKPMLKPAPAAAAPAQPSILLADDRPAVDITGHDDDGAGQPVPQAAVVLVGTALATTTTAAGNFALALPAAVLDQLPDAPVRLRLTYPGYAARLVELAPRPPELKGRVAVAVLVQPGQVQVTRIRTPGYEMAAMKLETKNPATFNWPPPHPATFCVLPDEFFPPSCRRLSQVDARLKMALKKAHFHSPAYYGIPDGFAMVTSIEQLDSDDNPLPGTNRWAPEEVRGSGLADFLRSLVSAHTGRFRVLVFAVTATPFAPTEDAVTKSQAMAWLDGNTTLPPTIGHLPWTADSHCTTLVYEFEKQESHAAALVATSQYSGQEHLAKAGITIEP